MDTMILLIFVLVCALSDLKTNRIPNTLILCGLAGALLSRIFAPVCGWQELFRVLSDSCAGFLLPWLLLGGLASLKMIGGGDVKLLSVIGLQLGAAGCLMVLWYSLIIAALWSVVLVLRRRNLGERLGTLYRYLGQTIASGQFRAYRSCGTGPPCRNSRSDGADRSGEFCLSPCILAALIFTVRPAFLPY